MKKVIPLLIAIALAGPALASCSGNQLDRWLYTKEDMSSFIEEEGRIITEGNSARVQLRTGYPLFKTNINASDIRIFDYQKALEAMINDGNIDYLDYNIINQSSVEIDNIETETDYSGLTAEFKIEEDKEYGMIINKDVTADGNFVICSFKNTNLGKYTDAQLEFEENYVMNKMDISSGVNFVWNVAGNIALIWVAGATGAYTGVVSGIVGVMNTLFSGLGSKNGPTTGDVMNKLDAMDKKIDAISEKIDENFEQLSDSITRVSAKVDEVLLNQHQQNITDFITDYVVPLDNYKRDLGDYIEQSYKQYVSKEEKIDMYFSIDGEGNYNYIPTLKESPTSQTLVSFTIENFPNAQKHLRENGNIVVNGFVDELYKDIDAAIANTTLPKGLDPILARNSASAHIIEEISRKYYQDNHQKALDLKNMMINYSKRISGRLGSASVINDYVSRIQNMYNFASEAKKEFLGLLSNYLSDLDRNIVLAGEACAYAETNNSELAEEYDYARKAIQKMYEDMDKIPDSYSYTSNTVLDSGFYKAMYYTNYTNPGNHATLHADLRFKKVIDGVNGNFEDIDIKKINFVEAEEHNQINTRRELLVQMGEIKNSGYADYLRSTNVLSSQANNAYFAMLRSGYVGEDAYRFATNLKTRNLQGSDRNMQFSCMNRGCRGSNYFREGWRGNYASYRSSNCWSGKIVESDFIDASTGTLSPIKTVAAYASYYESHWYWVYDELWSFIDNPNGNYMFILNHTI